VQVSDNLMATAKVMVGTGVPAWFLGITLTESVATSFNPNAFNTAVATLLLFGGVTLIATGLTAVVVGAAVADVQAYKGAGLNRAAVPARRPVAPVGGASNPVDNFIGGAGGVSGRVVGDTGSSGGEGESLVVLSGLSADVAHGALQRAIGGQP
jgi:hypothetical protein